MRQFPQALGFTALVGLTSMHEEIAFSGAPNIQQVEALFLNNGVGCVAEGAIDYIGPCPPTGTSHHHIWTIDA
jgi:phosphatidylethanolamine-binding protein (PEBP) family uncharacterized protein